MMSKINSIILSAGCVLVILASACFFVFSHRDTIINDIPSDVVAYIHVVPWRLERYSIQQKDKLTYLLNKTGLDRQLVVDSLALSDRELAFVKVKNTDWVMAGNNAEELVKYLNQKNIVYIARGETVFFPVKGLNLNDKSVSLAKISTSPRLNWDLSAIKVYYSGMEWLGIDASILGDIKKTDVWLFGNEIGGKLRFSSTMRWPKIKDKYSLVLDQGKVNLWWQGLTPSDLPFKVKNVMDNFDYILLSQFNVPVEYVNTDKGSIFKFENGLSAVDVVASLRNALAVIYPQEEVKELPDGTRVTYLVANPDLFDFALIGNDHYQALVSDGSLVLDIVRNGDYVVLIKNESVPTVSKRTMLDQAVASATIEQLNGIHLDFSRGILGYLDVCID